MCFSAPASFAAGAVLLPAGAYCVGSAFRKDVRYLPLALVPVAFALQQWSEGVVWLGQESDDANLVRQASVVFLFFAVAFWPFWIPLSLFVPETRSRHRTALGLLTVLSLVWFWFYYPVAADPQQWLSTEVECHSIQYNLGDLPGVQVLPRNAWRLAYLLAICLPLGLGRFGSSAGTWGNLLGGAFVAVLFCVSYLIYWYAFLSVWCFFAALLSLLLCHSFYKLPQRTSAPATPQVSAERRPIFS